MAWHEGEGWDVTGERGRTKDITRPNCGDSPARRRLCKYYREGKRKEFGQRGALNVIRGIEMLHADEGDKC